MGRICTMSKYQITLTPVDKFFFGNGMTFAIKGQDRDFENQYVSYIIESSIFPQQTSLVGMLRFLILRNAGDDVFRNGQIVDKTKAMKLIGNRSFMVNKDNDFKTIKGLGHIRIRRTANGQTSDLEYAPLFKELSFEHSSIGSYNLHDVCIPSLTKDEYNAKKGINAALTDGVKQFEFDDIFIKDRRVGINRDINTGKVNDGALFKQISYRFNNTEAHYCFVFDAEIEDHLPFESYKGQIVAVGGDNSQFVIGITKDVQTNNNINPYDKAVWLLSPTFLTRAEAKRAKFAVTRLVPFRFLKSEMDKVTSYNVLSKELVRSEKYELYAPGSVFYFEDETQKQEFINVIESKKDFRKIGYNEYK